MGRGSEEFVRRTSEPRECLLMSPVGRVNKSPALPWVVIIEKMYGGIRTPNADNTAGWLE